MPNCSNCTSKLDCWLCQSPNMGVNLTATPDTCIFCRDYDPTCNNCTWMTFARNASITPTFSKKWIITLKFAYRAKVLWLDVVPVRIIPLVLAASTIISIYLIQSIVLASLVAYSYPDALNVILIKSV